MMNLTTAHQKTDANHFPRVHITEKITHPTLTVHHPHITVKTSLHLHHRITNAHRHHLRKNKSSWKDRPLLAHHLTVATVSAKPLQS
jgi:hypothetical protein